MKTLIINLLAFLILLLGAVCLIQYRTNQSLKRDLAISTLNEKALYDDKVVLQFSIERLKHINDSVIQNLMDQKKKLNIRNKELQAMASLGSTFHMRDTILIQSIDTLKPLLLDTCLTDEWRSVCLSSIDNQLCTDVTVKSQKDVYVTTKRETIEPPKRFFICRWFQKKHTVTRVTVHEENPYIESQENVYVRITE